VQRFESEFLETMELKHADLLETIAFKKELNDEITNKLHGILKPFAESFKASMGA
jgi:F0F1-type ATP synthase alpha subunit